MSAAAIAKLLASLIPKDKLLETMLIAVAIVAVLLLIFTAIPSVLFKHIPMGKNDDHFNYYRDAVTQVKRETKVAIDFQEVMALDAVLLEQNFDLSSYNRAYESARNNFIKETTSKEEVACPIEGEINVSVYTIYEENDVCYRDVTVYRAISLDQVITNLINKGVLVEEQRQLILNYMIVRVDAMTSEEYVDVNNTWRPKENIYAWAVPGVYVMSSQFGVRIHPISGVKKNHNGLDVAAATGKNVVSIADGKILHTGFSESAGYNIIIDHGGGVKSKYFHLSYIGTKKGEEVTKGEYIGNVGSTGGSTGPHLHLEIHINGSPRNPYTYYK